MGKKGRQRAFKQRKFTDLKQCPNCKAYVPESLKGCWSCGYILDENIRNLAEANKK